MLRNSASTTAASPSLEQSFRDAEASLRLEGLDPTKDSRYLAVKAEVLAGRMTFEEAKAAAMEQYGNAVHSDSTLAISA